MGVTAADIKLLEEIIKSYQPRRVIELGAQNNFSKVLDMAKAPYMRQWYQAKNIHYDSIDLNGEDGAQRIDLSIKNPPWPEDYLYDMVTDFGTSEHINKKSKFSWTAVYNCWLNKHNLLKIGGIMISENPKTENWPGHGFNYYTQDFYFSLCKMAGYEIIEVGEIAAMGNTKDGWNVFCVMRKFSSKFPSLKEFQTLDLRKN